MSSLLRLNSQNVMKGVFFPQLYTFCIQVSLFGRPEISWISSLSHHKTHFNQIKSSTAHQNTLFSTGLVQINPQLTELDVKIQRCFHSGPSCCKSPLYSILPVVSQSQICRFRRLRSIPAWRWSLLLSPVWGHDSGRLLSANSLAPWLTELHANGR